MSITQVGNRTLKRFGHPDPSVIVLVALFAIFIAYTTFLALNMQRGIIPDEVAHFVFSQHYSSTWSIPEDVYQTYTQGWYIEQNPFLYYWLNGRALNVLHLILPSASDWQELVYLRLISVVYTLGTVIFCYLLSREVIRHEWWQLLPVFLLTNTLMLVFLSGGVNYDNLANLCCIAGLYFLVRVFNRKDFASNSLAWMLSTSLGTLVKYPILPFALGTGIAWLIFSLKHRKEFFPLKKRTKWLWGLILLVVAVMAINIGIYGVNLVKFGSITPACLDILEQEKCELSPYYIRHQQIALEQKLSILESIEQGHPNPLEYVVDTWITIMFDRIFGILAHKNYQPAHIIIFFRLLFFWMILLAFRYLKRPPITVIALVVVFFVYSLALFYVNYSSELTYGFLHIAVQGRYIFPVIGVAYVLFGFILANVQNKYLRSLTLFATLVLFLMGGPIKFITLYDAIFKDWFIP